MAVALTITENNRHVGLRDAESFGDIGLGHGAFQTPDLGHLFRRQEFLEKRNATDVDSMLSVHSVVYPFEIGDDTIRFHPVDVVDHREIFWIGDEGERNKSVQQKHLSPAVLPQATLAVAKFVDAGSENFSVASLRAVAPHSNSIDASNASKRADFVSFTEFGDGDTPPFFDEHNMDPFARSAHVIAPFCAHQGV